jgi:hypothetical protein
MPIHDWTRVDAGDFHDFHQGWTIAIRNALNGGLLPDDYFAMADQVIGGPIPDVITLSKPSRPREDPPLGGVAIAERPPRTRFRHQADVDIYAARADRVVIKHRHGEVVAVIEIVSPGNKDSRHALRSFVEKARTLLAQGIHLLVVDLFPPSPRDPQGIHKAIWDEIHDEPFELPPDKPLTVVAYMGGTIKRAYIEPVAVGDPLPDLPIFLSTERYIPAPLDATYQTTWGQYPAPLRELVETPPR